MTVPANSNALLLRSVAPATYQVSRSLRFSSGDSSYLSRTPASAGNRKKWTWSGWVKRSALGTAQMLFNSDGGTSDSTFGHISFLANDRLRVAAYNLDWRDTSAVFRDVSAWYHIAVIFNTTETTASDRVKVFVNGTQVTQFATTNDPSLNTDYAINQVAAHNIARTYSSYSYFNGYLADIWFLDGIAATPSDFAETDATTGQWIPKTYSGSKGSNGFHLEFADNSNNTATTLGKDTANSNNWTPNNFSVTAGAGNDSLVDTPTSYGTDTGAGGEVRGNYAVLSNQFVSDKTRLTMANGNLDVTFTNGGSSSSALSSIAVSSGKWYSEFTCTQSGSYYAFVGIIKSSETNAESLGYAGSYAYVNNSGNKVANGSDASYGATWTAGDVLGVALNLDAGTLTFYKNGVSQGTAYSSITGSYIIGCTGFSGWIFSANFGQRQWAYQAPAGFKALVDTNLTAPVVAKPSTAMDVALYTGTGSSRSISGLGFSPDFVWIKQRSSTGSHSLYDIVRGVGKTLSSNATNAEASEASTASLTSFDSTGFSLGTDNAGIGSVNANTYTYVAWAFDGGSSTVSNTQGSINSQVRANASAGFSIVTYTGNGTSGATVGHGLGVTPEFIVVKRRDTAGTGWISYHKSLTSNQYYMYLNTTAAQASGGVTTWNLSSTTVGLHSYTDYNANGSTYVMYAWAPVAGYSSAFSFTGTGSTDGPLIWLGFRARMILLKRTDVSGDRWVIWDTARNTYNQMTDGLFPNLSNAELNGYDIDVVANGFKMRDSESALNASGGTYIGFAWAESPFQYARAR